MQRAVKFVKYLPDAGWDSTVITTRSTVYPVADPTLAAELPSSTRIIRAREPRGAMGPAAVLGWLGLRRASRVAAFPDSAIGWTPDALRVALRAVRRERPSVLLSTSAPFSTHLVALAVHQRTGIPWVADFRDEWSANPALAVEPALVRDLAGRLERAITSRAAALVQVADYFRLANPADTPCFAIPNGVDEDDFAGIEKPAPRDVFQLSYVGTLYGERDATPVFSALERLVRRKAIDPSRVRVRLVGNDWRAPHARGSSVAVEALGYVTHREALKEMRGASVLLHYEAPSNPAPGGKIYEYLASGRPVLCVARPDGGAAALVRAAGAGSIAPPTDSDAIEEAVLALYERWRTTGLPDQPASREWVMANYSRRKLARDLADVLDRAAGAGTNRGS